MKCKPTQSAILLFNSIMLLTLFLFFAPSALYGEEFCPSLVNNSLLIAQRIDGDFRTSDSSITFDSFSMDQNDFEISGTLNSPNSSIKKFSYSGELYRIRFDDGSSVIAGTDNGDTISNLQLLRVLLDVSNASYQLIFFDTAENRYYQADGQLEQPIDHLNRFAASITKQLRGPEALEHYSLNRINKTCNHFSAMNNDKDEKAVATSTLTVESLIANQKDGQSTTYATYAGYRDLVDDVNSGKTVNINSYNIDTGMFTAAGTHHDSGWGSNPYAFSSLVVANGSEEYLVQVSLCDVIAIGNDSFLNGQGTVGLQMNYRGGFVGVYNKTTRTIQVRFINVGLMITDLQLAAGGLTNKAIFTTLISHAECGGTMSLSGYIALLNPSTAISSIFDYLTGELANRESIFIEYDRTYDAQMSRYGGKTIRSVSAKMDSGYMNLHANPTDPIHFMNVLGNVKLYNGIDTTFSWKWRYIAKGSI